MDDLEKAKAGNEKALSRLLRRHAPLVQMLAKRFADVQDAFQAGCVGLIKAIRGFDEGKGYAFSTYAVPLISGEIKRFLRDDGMVKVSRSLKENGWKINRVIEQKKRESGNDVTIQELAEETGLSKEEIVMAMEANIHVESIYKSVYQSDGSEIYLVDQVVAGGSGASLGVEAGNGRDKRLTLSGTTEDKEKEEVLNHMLLEQLLKDLGDSERNLIKMRYFENMTQVQVARILGISQVQVSRTEKKILQGMRKSLE